MFILLAAFLLLGIATPVNADFDTGKTAYDRGDYATALREWKPLAEKGNAPLVQIYLGSMYRDGDGVPQDYKEAVRWFRRAAEQGYDLAQFQLGMLYVTGEGVPQDYKEAMRWIRLAADQGLADAQHALGLLYYRGEGVKQDYAEAARWYRLAADQGYALAQFNLGQLYYDGNGVSQDYTEALRWYRLAAEQGYAAAQLELGRLYENGHGVKQDYVEAARWYRLAADQRYAKAQAQLGRLYYEGKGVPQNATEAAHWFRLAAEQGLPLVQHLLGEMYRDGKGIPQNFAEALYWFSTAAKNGLASSQVALGSMYFRGAQDGVTQNFALSAHWYRLAAEQGHTDGQFRLGFLYALGAGVPRDYVQAYMWLNLAAASDPKREIAEFLTEVEKKMAPEQIGEAQRLARQWKPKTPSPDRPQEASGSQPAASGTGFVISRQGHVLTNNHVIEGCKSIRSTNEGRKQPLTVVATDSENDLALLKLPAPSPNIARFREGRTIRAGDGVVAVGFPLHGLLAAEANVTTGTVSALAGLGNDTRFIQITVPIQPGNSGGPLLDQGGNIVGVIVSSLNAFTMAKATGSLPQNVNFAINGAVAKSFLDANSVEYEVASSGKRLETSDVGVQAKKFTLLLECFE